MVDNDTLYHLKLTKEEILALRGAWDGCWSSPDADWSRLMIKIDDALGYAVIGR